MYAQAMKRHEDGRTVQESRSLYGFVSLVYLIALLAVGTALVGHFGFPLDDSWIHQSVARNYATFGSLGYLPHERSSGSTSLLWTLILSCNYTVFPNVSPVIFTFVVNAALLIGSGLLLLRLALRDGLGPVPAMILAAAPAFDGNYVCSPSQAWNTCCSSRCPSAPSCCGSERRRKSDRGAGRLEVAYAWVC